MVSSNGNITRLRPAPPQKEAPRWFKMFMGTFVAAVFLLLCAMFVLVLALGVKELWNLL